MPIAFDKIADERGTIAAGGTLVGSIPPGRVLQEIRPRFTDGDVALTEAQVVADVKRIRCEIDGITKVDMSGRAAVMLANFYRPGSVGDGIVPIRFARPDMVLVQDQLGPAWGMSQSTRLTMTTEYDAAAANIDGQQTYYMSTDAGDVPGDEALGEHIETIEHNRSESAIGWHEIVINAAQARRLLALHVYDASLDIDEIRVWRNTPRGRVTMVPDMPVEFWNRNRAYSGREAEANWLHLDFDFRRYGVDAIPQDSPLVIGLYFGTAPGAFLYLTETAVGGAFGAPA
jgi:hypothetical protein